VFQALVSKKITFIACLSRVLLKSMKFERIQQQMKIFHSNGYFKVNRSINGLCLTWLLCTGCNKRTIIN